MVPCVHVDPSHHLFSYVTIAVMRHAILHSGKTVPLEKWMVSSAKNATERCGLLSLLPNLRGVWCLEVASTSALNSFTVSILTSFSMVLTRI